MGQALSGNTTFIWLRSKCIQDISQRYAISGRTLAIAEGEGRNILYLARTAREKHLAFNAEAWDYSQVALENAQVYAQEQGIELQTRQIDLTTVKWPEDQYDNILCVFGHVDPATRLKTLQGVRQALKNHGHFIGEVYSKAQFAYKTGGPGNPDFLYDPQEILEVFEDDHIVHFFDILCIHTMSIKHSLTSALKSRFLLLQYIFSIRKSAFIIPNKPFIIGFILYFFLIIKKLIPSSYRVFKYIVTN